MIRNKQYKWKLNSLGLNVDSALTSKLFFYEEEIIILGDTLVKARWKKKDIRDEGVDETILKINPEGVNSIYKKKTSINTKTKLSYPSYANWSKQVATWFLLTPSSNFVASIRTRISPLFITGIEIFQ